MTDAFEVLLQLAFLFLDLRDFLLGERLVASVGFHRFAIAKPREPALVHEEHSAALRFLGNRVLRLPLGADKQHRPSVSREVRYELLRLAEQPRRLREVDDVDPVPLAKDEMLHLRVPALRLVSEVDARLEQILQRDAGQIASIKSSQLPVASSQLEAGSGKREASVLSLTEL